VGIHAMKSVLIVDDDVKLCDMLREYLARRGFALSIQHCGHLGLKRAQDDSYDLMLLDVMLPDIDGFEVLRLLRRYSNLAVVLLSARGQASDRIQGLELGADDYLSKPFDPEELVARMNAVLRRGQREALMPAEEVAADKLFFAGLALDPSARIAKYKTLLLELTDIEFSLMEMFVRRPGVVLTREELVDRVLQQPFHPLNRSLDMHVCRLRKKLDASTPLGNSIKTIRSEGYLFSSVDEVSHS
jgi:two-component system response regulator CpxR